MLASGRFLSNLPGTEEKVATALQKLQASIQDADKFKNIEATPFQ